MKILEKVIMDDSFWKKVVEDTFKKAISTVVIESIKAVIDLRKREQLRHDNYAFEQWKKAREEDRKKAEADQEAEVGEKKKEKGSAKKATDDADKPVETDGSGESIDHPEEDAPVNENQPDEEVEPEPEPQPIEK